MRSRDRPMNRCRVSRRRRPVIALFVGAVEVLQRADVDPLLADDMIANAPTAADHIVYEVWNVEPHARRYRLDGLGRHDVDPGAHQKLLHGLFADLRDQAVLSFDEAEGDLVSILADTQCDHRTGLDVFLMKRSEIELRENIAVH